MGLLKKGEHSINAHRLQGYDVLHFLAIRSLFVMPTVKCQSTDAMEKMALSSFEIYKNMRNSYSIIVVYMHSLSVNNLISTLTLTIWIIFKSHTVRVWLYLWPAYSLKTNYFRKAFSHIVFIVCLYCTCSLNFIC